MNNTGWICPKCGFVYSPTTPVCLNCNVKPAQVKEFDKSEIGLPNQDFKPTCEQNSKQEKIVTCRGCGKSFPYGYLHSCPGLNILMQGK